MLFDRKHIRTVIIFRDIASDFKTKNSSIQYTYHFYVLDVKKSSDLRIPRP